MSNAVDIRDQDSFLQSMLNGEPLTIFLINGVKLKGILTGYDKECIVLSRDDSIQLIYKNAISTMMPFVERI